MTRNIFKVVVIVLWAVTITSCNEGSKAKRIVDDFMEANLTDADVSFRQYSRLDSTYRIDGKTIQKLRKEAAHIEGYQKDIRYTQQPTTKLLRIRVVYRIGKDTTLRAQTFYLDDKAQGIVAFKDN